MTEQPSNIQGILARSYLVYFVASLIGLFADVLIPIRFEVPYAMLIAVICFGVGPLLILWAQYTSRHFKADTTTQYFHHGPYKIMRNPTHLGVLILVTGYALITQSVIFFVITLIGYLVSNIFFKKYESLLTDVHGEAYESYKASVKRVL